MTKAEFINEVRSRLTGLAEEDITQALEFYEEAINDRIDDGLTEEQAIAAVGTPEEVSEKILMETPLPKLVKAQSVSKPKRAWRVWEIVLIVLGSPVWLPLIVAAAAVALALVISLFAVIFSVIIAIVAVGIGGVVSVFASLIGVLLGKGIPWLIQLGASLVIAGIAVLLFIPLKAGLLWLTEYTGRLIKRIKQYFIDKRKAGE